MPAVLCLQPGKSPWVQGAVAQTEMERCIVEHLTTIKTSMLHEAFMPKIISHFDPSSVFRTFQPSRPLLVSFAEAAQIYSAKLLGKNSPGFVQHYRITGNEVIEHCDAVRSTHNASVRMISRERAVALSLLYLWVFRKTYPSACLLVEV